MTNAIAQLLAAASLLVAGTEGAWDVGIERAWETNAQGDITLPNGIYAKENVNGQARPAGDPGCMCAGVCTVAGDPHVFNVWNERYTEKRERFDIFSSNKYGLEIQADTREHYFMEEIRFNNQVIHSDHCKKNGYYNETEGDATFTHTNNKDNMKVEMVVKCAQPKNRNKFGRGFHLDITLSIETSESMGNVEANGVCIEHHEDTGFDPDAEAPNNNVNSDMECECLASCSAFGDPHLDSFADNRAMLRNHDLMIYADGQDFEAHAIVQEDGAYMTKITVTGKKDKGGKVTQEFDVELCEPLRMSGGRNQIKIGEFDYPAGTSGRVWGVVNCAVETEGKREGTKYLDIHLNRNKIGNAQTFIELEGPTDSYGACTDGVRPNPIE